MGDGGIPESQRGGSTGVQVRFAITRDEFTSFARWQVLHMPGMRWTATGMVLLVLAGLLLLSSSDTTAATIELGAVGAWLLLVGVLILATPRRAWSRLRPDAKGLQSLHFSEEGIHASTPNTDSTVKWTVYKRMIALDDVYLLGTHSKLLFRLVPRRAFRTPADEAEFIRLVRLYVSDRTD